MSTQDFISPRYLIKLVASSPVYSVYTAILSQIEYTRRKAKQSKNNRNKTELSPPKNAYVESKKAIVVHEK